MGILQKFEQMIDYVLQAVRRIFGPSDDDYPNSGVQPYEGEEPEESRE